MMGLLTRVQHSLSRCGKYSSLLSQHVLSIMRKDECKYSKCMDMFDELVATMEQGQAKRSCNMLFNVANLPQHMFRHRDTLASLILSRTICDQSELDQTVKWIEAQIKINCELSHADILAKLGQRGEELQLFLEDISRIDANSSNLQHLRKHFREKYVTLSSTVIYEQIKLLAEKRTELKAGKESSVKDMHIWDRIGKLKPRLLQEECNQKNVYAEHLQVTQGKLRFRFPPQPNGYLHIGHVKSIRINFETAKRLGGVCYLRYDDTNPAKESHEYIREIEENVRWLGYIPDKITYASDYFALMIEKAVQLIKDGHAYVCDTPQPLIEAERGAGLPNPQRDRPIHESLMMFPGLQPGQTLRLKGDPASKNPTLRDPIIYRRKDQPHPRTGRKYNIYPIYDFAHCISDSIEHIDYSLCSLEFEVRRELYYRILHLLGIYKPHVWEYSRLNVSNNVLSKRHIKRLIDQGKVDGWQDPRLLTIRGLKNRGYTPQMLLEFVDRVNSSRAGNENVVQYDVLEKVLKKHLFSKSPKLMAVLDPRLLCITNLDVEIAISVKLFQEDAAMTRQITLSPEIYIEEADACLLKPHSVFILKYAGAYRVERITSEDDGQVIEAIRLQEPISDIKCTQSVRTLHWISRNDSKTSKTIVYQPLLLGADINPSSKTVYLQARIPHSATTKEFECWQFERIGYFKIATESECTLLCCVKL